LQQIAERRAAIPVLGNVQLARRLAEPRRNQHHRYLRPGDALLADRKQPLAQILEPHPAPQCQRQVHVAELTRALDANALQAHPHRPMRAAVVEQLLLFRGADQTACQGPRLDATALIELAEMRNSLLNDTTTDTHAAHEAPVAVNLAVLPYRRVAQVHASNQI
jgi:hypothetical protein